MARGGLFALLVGVAITGAARPPVIAPKPSIAARIACGACRIPALPKPQGRIRPVQQDGPAFESPVPTPEPLPLPRDVTPLPAEEPGAVLSDLLDKFLPDVKPEERNAWADELRHLPPELARDILAARSRENGSLTLPLPDPALDFPLPPQTEPTDSLPLRIADRGTDTFSATERTLAALRTAESIRLHNIANADTIAFKRSRPIFDEAGASGGIAGMTPQRVDTQGELDETGRPFDLAIDGAGYFRVRRGGALAFTRHGTFGIAADGTLALRIAGADWPLHPPLPIPPETTEIVVTPEGAVGCRLSGDEELTQVGQIDLIRAVDPAHLEPAGSGLLTLIDASGPIVTGLPGENGLGTVRQGALERSNVNLTEEVAALHRLREQLSALQTVTPSQLASPQPPAPIRSAETPAPPAF